MKRKRKKTNTKSEIFNQIINCILFGNPSHPSFVSSFENLSFKFVNACLIRNTDLESNYLREKITVFLYQIDNLERKNIYNFLIKNTEFINLFSLVYLINKSDKVIKISDLESEINLDDLDLQLLSFRIEGNIVKEIVMYLILFFEELLYLELENKERITKSEYFEIVNNFNCKKFIYH